MKPDSTSSNSETIEKMADAMLRYGEGCTRDDLAMHFTGEEIERFQARARAIANDRAVRQTRAARPSTRAA